MEAITSSLSESLRMMFGMEGWEVRKNTLRDSGVVDGIAAMVTNSGAPGGSLAASWHCTHVASTSRFPVTGSPICGQARAGCMREGAVRSRRLNELALQPSHQLEHLYGGSGYLGKGAVDALMKPAEGIESWRRLMLRTSGSKSVY
jgi:hypothetical protein